MCPHLCKCPDLPSIYEQIMIIIILYFFTSKIFKEFLRVGIIVFRVKNVHELRFAYLELSFNKEWRKITHVSGIASKELE